MVSLKKPNRWFKGDWHYTDCVEYRKGDPEYYPLNLQIWSGGADHMWVVQMVDDKLFWVVDGTGPWREEPKLFGPYETSDAAKAAAEMLSEIT